MPIVISMRIKLSEWAKQEGIAYRTAVTHYHQGLIPNAIQKPTGTIMVNLPEPVVPSEEARGVALYSRVSSSQNKDNLLRQQSRLEDYAAARGYQIKHNITEVGSGMNDQRPKLLKLLNNDNWSILIVEHEDRLTRFGYTFMEELLARTGQKIEIINTAEDKDDLIQDFISIITSFSARIYGRRRSKRQIERLIKELENNEPANH